MVRERREAEKFFLVGREVGYLEGGKKGREGCWYRG